MPLREMKIKGLNDLLVKECLWWFVNDDILDVNYDETFI